MKHIIKSSYLLPIIALLFIGWGGSWKEIQQTTGTITSVQAEFVQEKHLPILATPLVSKGMFYYQGPRSLRWEYQHPVRSILLMHDGRVRQFVAGASGFKEQGNAGLQGMQVVLEEITDWLMGRFDTNPMFDAQLADKGRIVLKPKEAAFNAVIEQIVIQLSETPGIIKSVTIYESPTAFTQMTFNHTILNQPIDDAVFQDVP